METLKSKWTTADPLSRLELAEGETVRAEGWAGRLMWGYASHGTLAVTSQRLVYRARIPKFGNLERRVREVRLAMIDDVKVSEPSLIESLLLPVMGHDGKATRVSLRAREGTLRDFFCSPALADVAVRACAAVTVPVA
jgi:hypothetical protein